MTQHPTDASSALAMLREAHPDWFFTTTWVAAGTGPDKRLLVAQRRGVVLSDFTAEALSRKIDGEQTGPVLDSEPWTCRSCHVPHIGRRPADDLCRDCRAGFG